MNEENLAKLSNALRSGKYTKFETEPGVMDRGTPDSCSVTDILLWLVGDSDFRKISNWLGTRDLKHMFQFINDLDNHGLHLTFEELADEIDGGYGR
jgi:hypothetical protein